MKTVLGALLLFGMLWPQSFPLQMATSGIISLVAALLVSYQALASITAPTLVIHGTADPMFPLRHGEELAAAIPGARLLPVEGAGHGVDRTDWGTIVAVTVEHTSAADGIRGRLPPRVE